MWDKNTKWKAVTLAVSVVMLVSWTGCSTTNDRNDDKEHMTDIARLNPNYLFFGFAQHTLVLGFSPDGETIIAYRELHEQGYLAFIDAYTGEEKGRLQLIYPMSIAQKRIRFSADRTTFMLTNAWGAIDEMNQPMQAPVYLINVRTMGAHVFGFEHIKEEAHVLHSPSFDHTGDYVMFSVDREQATDVYRYSKEKEEVAAWDGASVEDGTVVMLNIQQDLYIEIYDNPKIGKIGINRIEHGQKESIMERDEPHDTLYIKDYDQARSRILVFATTLTVKDPMMVTETITPYLIEFDESYESYEVQSYDIADRMDVLNGILTPDGRHTLFIAYDDQQFILLLVDHEDGSSVRLLSNEDIESTFMGAMPGRIDGLFISDDARILLVADTGIFLFDMEFTNEP